MNKATILLTGLVVGAALGVAGARLAQAPMPHVAGRPARHLESSAGEPSAVLALPMQEEPPAYAASGAEEIRNRLTVLASLREADRVGWHCAPLGTWNADHLITEQFAYVYGLSPSELSRLEAAMQRAKLGIESMQRSLMVHHFDAAGGVLTITIPSTAASCGPVHDAALGAMREVLGAERFSFFEKLSADNFEVSFSGLGSATLHYSIRSVPLDPGMGPENACLEIEERADYPGGGYRTSTSRLRLEDIPRFYPVSAPLLEQYFSKPRQ